MTKKANSLIIACLLFTLTVSAQQTFEKVIAYPEDEMVNSVVEDNEGNFVMVGRIYDIETNRRSGYVLKIDGEGNLLRRKIIKQSDTSTCLFHNIHFFNGQYYTLGASQLDSGVDRLWYLKLNQNLEILNEKTLNIAYGRDIQYGNSILDSDTNFVITGYTIESEAKETDREMYDYDTYFYKISIDGDSIIAKFKADVFPLNISYDIIETNDNSKYYAFGWNIAKNLRLDTQMHVLNHDFDSLATYEVPNGVFGYFSPTYLDDGHILICCNGPGTSLDPNALVVLSLNDQAEIMHLNYFERENDMDEYPSFQNGISKRDDFIYAGGTSNFDIYNPFYSFNNSWFHLIRINPDITPVWEYWYGGDAYYFLYSILATSDGGCLLVGSRYDDAVQYMERDIYVVKVNSDGLIVWTQEIPVDQQQMLVYPNPGTSYFAVQTRNQQLELELISLNGQVVIKQTLNSDANTVETERLPSGIYFYRLTNTRTHAIESGKWIKK